MADLSITAANVALAAGGVKQEVTWGGTITAGIPVYEATDGHYEACDATALASVRCAGIALCGGGDGQPGWIAKSGDLNPGATVALGSIYVVSATEGKICPSVDILTTEFVCILGVADTTSNIILNIFYSEVAHV